MPVGAHTSLSEPSAFKDRLAGFYREQDTIPKLIDDDSIPKQHLNDYYIKLQMILKESIKDKGHERISGHRLPI